MPIPYTTVNTSVYKRNVTSYSTASTTVGVDEGHIEYDTSAGLRQLTLPAISADNDGKVFYIRKSSNDLNRLAILTPGADTIGGNSDESIYSQFEAITIVADNTNKDWILIRRDVRSEAIDYTPSFQGFGTVSTQYSYYTRFGPWIYLSVKHTCGTNTASEAQTTLPSGLSVGKVAGTSPYLVGVGQSTTALDYIFAGLFTFGDTFINYSRRSSVGSVAGMTVRNGNSFTNGDTIHIHGWIPIDEFDA